MQIIDLSDKQLKAITEFLFVKSGIRIDDQKKTMVQSRLNKRYRTLGITNWDDYISLLQRDPLEETEFINALTTNKTEFFRELPHFAFLKEKILPNFKGQEKCLIWSAACSTGEELYTVALLCEEHLKKVNPSFNYQLLGTDIDSNILTIASRAIYREDQVAPIPPEMMKNNFLRGKGDNESLYAVSEHLKRNVEFRKFNLVRNVSKPIPKFHCIFLRNVLIYFPKDIIQIVIDTISGYLLPDGYLFIGHSETLNDIKHDLQSLGSATYKKRS